MLKVATQLSDEEEAIVSECLGCGIAVHRELGPGFKEVIYHRAFALEANSRGLHYEVEKKIDVKFKQWLIPGQKVDLIVEGVVLVEIKTVPRLKTLHRDQVLSYLKTMGPENRTPSQLQLVSVEEPDEANCALKLCAEGLRAGRAARSAAGRRPPAGNPTGWTRRTQRSPIFLVLFVSFVLLVFCRRRV